MKNLKELVESMKIKGLLKNPEIEKAFLKIPREKFFPGGQKEFAYDDSAFPIGEDSTISQPSTIAYMLELLEAKEGETIMEVGSGSGYVLALINQITKRKVYGVEINQEVAKQAIKTLEDMNINSKVLIGDVKEQSFDIKFDKILVSAAMEKVPDKLFEILKENGKIVAPVGKGTQALIVYNKQKEELFKLEGFIFVKLQ